MISRTSEVAACCSCASFSSRVWRSSFSCRSTTDEWPLRADIDALVHYTPNDIGDFQTGAVTHQGLTSFGAEVIRACHRLGFVCDVAHATEDTVKQAVKVATKPLLLSHSALSGSQAMGPTPLTGRQISRDHARAIAETGGSIGIWHFFPSLDKYVDGLKEMAEIVGVDHVSIGTDQQITPGSMQDYAQWVQLVAAMMRGGFTPEEAGSRLQAATICESFVLRSADLNARSRFESGSG